jgi:hypothetical protein
LRLTRFVAAIPVYSCVITKAAARTTNSGRSGAAGREFYSPNHTETSPEMPDFEESSTLCFAKQGVGYLKIGKFLSDSSTIPSSRSGPFANRNTFSTASS